MKRIFCALLVVLMLISLVACGKDKKKENGNSADTTVNEEEPWENYDGMSEDEANETADEIKAYLECSYRGVTDGLEDGQTLYDERISTIADYMISFGYLDFLYIDEETAEQYRELAKTLASKIDYEVSVKEKKDGSFVPFITMEQIDIYKMLDEQFSAISTRYSEIINSENPDIDAITEEQWFAYEKAKSDEVYVIYAAAVEAAAPADDGITLYEGLEISDGEYTPTPDEFDFYLLNSAYIGN